MIHKILFRSILFLIVFIFSNGSFAQTITGQVLDPSGKPLAFASIKFDETKEGIIANLDGKFSFNSQVKFIEVSHTNYTSQKVEIFQDHQKLVITLQPAPVSLQTVIIKGTSGNKLKRILNTAIANRNMHNPDKYDWYQCNVYYKMAVDIIDPHPLIKKDTNAKNNQPHDSLPGSYFLLTETFSKRTWQKPAKLQEEIIASRMSGFTKPLIATLVTDVLPFHAYDDFINLNGKDFYNPVSKGLFQRFHFKISDEIVQEADTTWVINFQPKLDPADLAGTVYITSDGFAITHIIAHSKDSSAKKDLGIEQQYAKHDGKWFPQQLNYILQWQISKEDSIEVSMKGTSVIDSVTFKNNTNFQFDKAHTIKILANAEDRKDSAWIKYRPIELDAREKQTYRELDSAFKKTNIEKLTFYASKFLEGKFPAGKFDIDLNRIYSYNAFENSRVGWGMQTNEKFSKSFSVGGWAGYGTKDKQWKYGAFAELYVDRYKEFIVKANYYKDLRDPGRLQIHKEIDNNTLRQFLISRADKVEGWNISLQKKLGYLNLEIVAGKEDIKPLYDYAFNFGNKNFKSFSVNELSVNLRYAYGETSSPFLGKYFSTKTKYPVLYSRIITGKITNANISYTQTIAAISWAKNINRLGKEHFLLSGGVTLGKQPLPISKLFAGNGFDGPGTFIYAFGAMETMLPYQFYSDRFINLYWLHEFNRSILRAKLSKGLSIAPKPAIAYNLLYGTLKNISVHNNINFLVPDKGYHETGLMLNNVFVLKLLGLYSATFKAGYFHNIFNANNYPKQGRFVYGIGLEL